MKSKIPPLGSLLLAGLAACFSGPSFAADPPAINPFGARTTDRQAIKNPFGPQSTVRDDAVPGYVELSDGKIHYGMVHLTRDQRLKINDEKIARQREVPLRVVTRIDCIVEKEWMEREWRFKELALDEKMYTGKQYPAREYLHEITLRDGRKIKGPLMALVYVQPDDGNAGSKTASRPKAKTKRFTLHKRDKGKPGKKLTDLVYVKSIKLGQGALEEGRQKAREKAATKKPRK